MMIGEANARNPRRPRRRSAARRRAGARPCAACEDTGPFRPQDDPDRRSHGPRRRNRRHRRRLRQRPEGAGSRCWPASGRTNRGRDHRRRRGLRRQPRSKARDTTSTSFPRSRCTTPASADDRRREPGLPQLRRDQPDGGWTRAGSARAACKDYAAGLIATFKVKTASPRDARSRPLRRQRAARRAGPRTRPARSTC